MSTTVAGIAVAEIEYAQESGIVRTQFDPEKTSASIAVVATLADILDTDPVELDTLYPTIDPDALDSFVAAQGETDGNVHVAFTHEGYEIRVHSSGVVTATPEPEPAAETHARDVRK